MSVLEKISKIYDKAFTWRKANHNNTEMQNTGLSESSQKRINTA